MAYGQTGSGKTYTMLGDNFTDLHKDIGEELDMHPSDGVIPRAAVEMFKYVH